MGYALLHEIKTKLVDENWSLTKITQWLHDPRCLEMHQGPEGRKGRQHVAGCECRQTNVGRSRGADKYWSAQTLKRVLTSQRTQGYRVVATYEPAPTEDNPDHKKRTGEKLVLDSEGQPIRMAEPTFLR